MLGHIIVSENLKKQNNIQGSVGVSLTKIRITIRNLLDNNGIHEIISH